MSTLENCWIPKAGSGKGVGFMSLFLVFGLIGGVAIGVTIQPMMNQDNKTKINIQINDFYLKLYDGTDFLGLNSSYELMSIMIYYMEFDLAMFNNFLRYDNITDYIENNNASTSSFGSLGILNLKMIGNEKFLVNMFGSSPTFDEQIDLQSIDNKKFTLEWANNKVILINGITFMVANRTSEDLGLMMGDSFDITGNNIADIDEEHLDIVNMTSVVKDYVYYPNIIYNLEFNGVDYDIGTEDFSNLYLMDEHDTSITITDKNVFFMFGETWVI